MGRHAKTLAMLAEIIEILERDHPMTVRQVFYRLVSGQVIENTRSRYQAVSNVLRDARKCGVVPWEQVEDRLRRPRIVNMWSDLADFADTVQRAYRRDVWIEQPTYFETWLEKDALSGIFEDVLQPYGLTLNVGRGYDGWDSIRNAAERFLDCDREDTAILYFGDFDPSGENMVDSLRKRLAFFDCEPEIIKCALTAEDIQLYNLPPGVTKEGDTRSKAFIEKFGDVCVELDALPGGVLRDRLTTEVEKRMDMRALAKVKAQEERERTQLIEILTRLKNSP